jgi:histone deacetylase complex regulatory component SIN3
MVHSVTHRCLLSLAQDREAEAERLRMADPWAEFKTLLRQLLDQEIENMIFEDELRARFFGVKSYKFFTIDRVVHKLVRALEQVGHAVYCVVFFVVQQFGVSTV